MRLADAAKTRETRVPGRGGTRPRRPGTRPRRARDAGRGRDAKKKTPETTPGPNPRPRKTTPGPNPDPRDARDARETQPRRGTPAQTPARRRQTRPRRPRRGQDATSETRRRRRRTWRRLPGDLAKDAQTARCLGALLGHRATSSGSTKGEVDRARCGNGERVLHLELPGIKGSGIIAEWIYNRNASFKSTIVFERPPG